MATSLSRRISAAALVLAIGLLIGRTLVLRADPLTTSRLHWITNGDVTAGTVLGDTLYIAGSFTEVALGLGAGTPRAGIAAFSVANDALLPWAPALTGSVASMVSREDRVFVNVQTATGLVLTALTADTGAQIWSAPNLSAAAAESVGVIATDSSVTPARLVRVNPSTGAVDAGWTPSLGGPALVVTSDGERVIVGRENWFAEVDLATGVAGPWREALPGEFSVLAPDGTFYVRVRASGTSGPAATPSNEVAVVIGCTAPPLAPTNLVADIAGSLVSVHWTPSPFASLSGYLLEAGRAPWASDVAVLSLGAGATAFSTAAAPGTYFVRTRAVNARGRSAPSAEVFLTVGAPDPLPPAPTVPTATVDLSPFYATVTLQWPAVPDAAGYLLEVGSAPGRTDLYRIALPVNGLVAPGVPYGLYFVRVRAVNGAGLGPPSHELVAHIGS